MQQDTSKTWTKLKRPIGITRHQTRARALCLRGRRSAYLDLVHQDVSHGGHPDDGRVPFVHGLQFHPFPEERDLTTRRFEGPGRVVKVLVQCQYLKSFLRIVETDVALIAQVVLPERPGWVRFVQILGKLFSKTHLLLGTTFFRCNLDLFLILRSATDFCKFLFSKRSRFSLSSLNYLKLGQL